MFLLEWTFTDLVLMLTVAAGITALVAWLTPRHENQPKVSYTTDEITAYDRRIPLYFIAAAVALVAGALHIVVKNVPGFWQWLWRAGYGGHLFRDLSNSHIIIVGGGTVLLTGITWYVLPRIVNRPLYSDSLASVSFWFTVVGVFSFYLSWLVLGLVEGNLVVHGVDYMAAKELLGSWHTIPTRITSSVMGVGYWTYVLNVFLTLLAARRVAVKPLSYLSKFVAVSAAALFVGTVQGVLQVLPDNADWIHLAGKFGQYVDPISHAHINLVTGMMVSLAALLVFFSERLGGRSISKHQANLMFWTLVPGSLIFYLSFLLLGLILGNNVNGYGGIHVPSLAAFASLNRATILAVSGTLMLVGFWVYFVTLWKTLDIKTLFQQIRDGTPAAFWLVSSLALVIGTFQGILQVIPVTAAVLTAPEEVPNIHAQLNMIGGVLAALIGIVYLLLPELLGHTVSRRMRRTSLLGIASGIGGYYVTTLATGLVRLHYLRMGLGEAGAAARMGWVAPSLLVVVALPLLAGFASFALGIFQVTEDFRAAWRSDVAKRPARYNGPMPERLRHIPRSYVIGAEFIGGLFGWPGLGWLYAGQALPALALLMGGPSIAWALLPILFSPFSNTSLSPYGWKVLLVWLPLSATVSSALLALYLAKRAAARHRQPLAVGEVAMSKNGKSARPYHIPPGLIGGAAVIVLMLVSIPIVTMLGLRLIPDEVPQQNLLAALPERADGAYLEATDQRNHNGYVKLFAWSFPLDEVPDETPVLKPEQVKGLTISQKGLEDSTDQYRLWHIEDDPDLSHLIPLETQVTSFQREMRLVPTENPLETGSYMLDMPIGGMFAGREYYYFRIDPEAPTQLVYVPAEETESATSASTSTAPAQEAESHPAGELGLEIFPLCAALFSAAIATIMARRLLQKVRPHEVAWMVAFVMFAVAAGTQLLGDLTGWTPTMARLYYVTGATLVVGWLGLGSWLVLVRQPAARNAGIWLILLLTGFGLGLVALSPVDATRIAGEGWHALDKPTALTILTIALNSIGTLVLVGGALWSAWSFWRKRMMPQRMVGLILLAVGAMVVAAGGSLTRLGHEQYLYIAMSVGVLLMFWGYLRTIAPEKSRVENPTVYIVPDSAQAQIGR
jgi:hypothetical protein